MKITVIVPTYRRTKDLTRCLESLQKQSRPADEVLVVVRDTDVETWQFLATTPHSLPLRTTTVCVPGVVAAMNAGLDIAQGDIIAFTDDDAAPHSNWLAQIETHFLADEQIAGVGGRDWVYHGDRLEDGTCPVVGQVHWFGRVTGNHHIGIGNAREVDVLKGVNMSFRRSAVYGLRFDQRMLGTGAQVHFEVAFCLALKRAGWKLIYDPQVGVNHYPAQRFDEDQRQSFNHLAVTNAVHNETLALLEHLSPTQQLTFFLWATLVGTRDAMGLIQFLRFLPSDRTLAAQKLLAAWHGRWRGWRTWQNSIRFAQIQNSKFKIQN